MGTSPVKPVCFSAVCQSCWFFRFCKNACQFAEHSPSEGQAASFCVVHVADSAFLLCLVARRDAAMELQSNAPQTECKPCPNIVQMPLPHGNCRIQAMLANYQGHACSQKICSNLWLLSVPGGLKHFAMDLPKNRHSQNRLVYSDAAQPHQPILQLHPASDVPMDLSTHPRATSFPICHTSSSGWTFAVAWYENLRP